MKQLLKVAELGKGRTEGENTSEQTVGRNDLSPPLLPQLKIVVVELQDEIAAAFLFTIPFLTERAIGNRTASSFSSLLN